jgi:hypothetical protein
MVQKPGLMFQACSEVAGVLAQVTEDGMHLGANELGFDPVFVQTIADSLRQARFPYTVGTRDTDDGHWRSPI